MELQQNLNLIIRILKQTVGLQHICSKDFIHYREAIKPFFRFLEIRQYCAEPALNQTVKLKGAPDLRGIETQNFKKIYNKTARVKEKLSTQTRTL